jgi:CRP-like cAMP-binding protein
VNLDVSGRRFYLVVDQEEVAMLPYEKVVSALISVDPRWGRDLEPFRLPAQSLLGLAHRAPRHIHFLSDGFVTLRVDWCGTPLPEIRTPTKDDPDGDVAVEMVGTGGVVGADGLVDSEALPYRIRAETAVAGRRIPTARAREIMTGSEPSRRILERSRLQRLTEQNLRSAGAVRLKRLARLAFRLVEVSDLLASDTIPMTHIHFADVTGERRPTVTEDLGHLADRGMIVKREGEIRIHDEAALMAFAGPLAVELKRSRAGFSLWLGTGRFGDQALCA